MQWKSNPLAVTRRSLFQWHEGDLWLYYDSSLKLMQGQLPYRNFPLEYPPLALLPFVLPHLVTLGQPLGFTDYVRLFGSW